MAITKTSGSRATHTVALTAIIIGVGAATSAGAAEVDRTELPIQEPKRST